MTDPFTGEVRIFAGNFAIRNWAFCDGQLISIAQNTALFSILGATYGGDGRSNFGLPNLQGRMAMHVGHGPGLTPRRAGQTGGTESVTLTEGQLPAHSHTMSAVATQADASTPIKNLATAATPGGRNVRLYREDTSLISLAEQSLLPSGGNGVHSNDQPYQVVTFLIALVGEYPGQP